MPTRQPNILFIMTDQQRFDCLGVNGNPIIHTPNLDRLARSGVDVKKYYVNAPVCVPSRCTLFTGRYPHATRIRQNFCMLERGREIHLFRALKHEGYSLGYIGKNHLLEDEEWQNFDYTDVWGYDHEMSPEETKTQEFAQGRMKPMVERGAWAGATFHDFPLETTRPYVKADSAIRFLKGHRGQETSEGRCPFCLTLSFSDPHAPHIAPRKFESVYPLDTLTPYPTREGELQEKAARFGIKYLAQQADQATDEDKRRFMAVYYAMISWVDEQIGRVLDTLDDLGLREDTIVVFTSDHGEFCFEHDMVKKDLVLLESLLHVPFLVSWAGTIPAGTVDDTFTEEVDVVPTLLESVGAQVPFGVQGKSVLPILMGQGGAGDSDGTSDRVTVRHKDAVFAESCPPWLYNPFESFETFREDWEANHDTHFPFNIPGDYNKAVRDDRFRYIWYGTGEEELYDLEADPHEQHNVAADQEYRQAKLEMKCRLLEWNIMTEDPLCPKTVRMLQKQYPDWIGKEDIGGNDRIPGDLTRILR